MLPDDEMVLPELLYVDFGVCPPELPSRDVEVALFELSCLDGDPIEVDPSHDADRGLNVMMLSEPCFFVESFLIILM